MLTLDFLQGDMDSIQTQQSLMAKSFRNELLHLNFVI